MSRASSAVMTTRAAISSAVHVPVALSAPVIAYSLSYQPFCPAREGDYTEEEARACGYDSLAELPTRSVRHPDP